MIGDERLKAIYENFDQLRLGLDDVFAFKCIECGKCCKNREDILLTARDLFRIALKLKIPITKVLDDYCEMYVGQYSRIPVVRLLPVGNNRVCPLLKGLKCSVHDHKPAVCALFPLGRAVQWGKNDDGTADLDSPTEISYFRNDHKCRTTRKQTVRTWLELFGIVHDDPYYIKWVKTTAKLGMSIRKFEENGIGEEALKTMWDGMLAVLYITYDTNKEFEPQFEMNANKLLGVMAKTEQAFYDARNEV